MQKFPGDWGSSALSGDLTVCRGHAVVTVVIHAREMLNAARGLVDAKAPPRKGKSDSQKMALCAIGASR